MNESEQDQIVYKVVINQEEQYSICPRTEKTPRVGGMWVSKGQSRSVWTTLMRLERYATTQSAQANGQGGGLLNH